MTNQAPPRRKIDYSVAEVAKLIHMSTSGVLYLLKTGKLQSVRIGLYHRISIGSVVAYQAQKALDKTK